MTVLIFPTADQSAANAQNLDGIVNDALAKLGVVASEVMATLRSLDEGDLNAIYDARSNAMGRGVEDSLFYELLTAEVEQRCILKGTPAPWEDELAVKVAANDDPDNGAA